MKFNFFNPSKPVVPDFEALKKSPLKDLYFYRTAKWHWINNDIITIIDSHAPRMITLDPWPQMVFLGASGKLTIGEYAYYVVSKYKKEIPADLDITILSMIDLLLKDKVICLSEVIREPDPENNRPFK
ncbi:hypothetical protein AB6805_13965 [Chitinophaga sp. RCC_12]|uniref:hypothetical protein n=1 Tax=Chitinophaga sp. RCC_12 TaxID=3239226 RepID=UPI00352674AB